MRIVGIIAEYNPLHLGHLYHLQTAKETAKADFAVCVLSSNFVQRGEPSIVDKWARCQMALEAGIDLVIELPAAFSCRSALWFAYGGISLLNACGIITHLAFGAETAKLEKLKQIASILNKETQKYQFILERHLKSGFSYPKARSLTLKEFLAADDGEIIEALDNPNNILALAYLRVLEKTESAIEPVLIKRIGDTYHADEINNDITSASAIRNSIFNNSINWYDAVPPSTKNILLSEFNQKKGPVHLHHFNQAIFAIIRRSTPFDLQNIIEVNEGLENRIWRLAQECGCLNELINNLKTKRYTHTRIQRLLTHILLNYNKTIANPIPSYLRILGFNSHGQKLLKLMKNKCSLPIVTKLGASHKKLTNEGSNILELELRSSDLYALGFSEPTLRLGRQDFYNSPIIKN